MDPFVLFLLVVIVLAGGFIGVLADHLGRRIGKKKLSFRSMRPKRVAQLGTFIAGSLVALITILLVYSTSSGIREWITQGRAAIVKARILTRQNAGLEADIRARTADIDQLKLDARVARSSLNEATAKLASIQSDLRTANTRLAQARQRVTVGEQALLRNQVLLRQSQAKLKEKQNQLALVGSKLRSAQDKYAELQKSFGAVNQERKEANEEVVSLRTERNVLKSELATLRSETAELTKEKEQAGLDLQSAKSDLHDSQLMLASVKSDLDTARVQLYQAQAEAIKLLGVASGARSKPMTYAIGQEVARKRVGSNLSERQARDALNGLLRDASALAHARGAGLAANSELYVNLPQQRDTTGAEEGPTDLQAAIVEGLKSHDRDVVLIATAVVNSFQGEPVPLQIIAYHNPIIYHKGEVLGTLSVPRRSPPTVVLNQFTEFMNQRIHPRAIRDGMIPAAGEEGSLLDLAPAKTIALVERLSSAERPQDLQIVVRTDTRAADALQLDFVIK